MSDETTAGNVSLTEDELYAIWSALSGWIEDRTSDEKSEADAGEAAQKKIGAAIRRTSKTATSDEGVGNDAA